MTELDRYRIAVSDYARNKKDYLFHNEGNEHALIILTNIFLNANSHIRIAANKLYNDEVVNTKEYIDAICNFLNKKDTRLEIIITNRPQINDLNSEKKEKTFYWAIYNHEAYSEKRVIIKDGNGGSFKEKDNPVNFCTGDEHMYRYEIDINQRKATANFNDKNTTKKLNSSFDKAFSELQCIDLKEYFR